ncbi:polysaccharide lyase family 7 protein [Streptomyces cocklensis]|uniref:Ricin-type beta-trefoil lectin domain-containing protein n=1 Tax=Actinacidiphila cocklensis TaxID=887465 RepID=A0A9W4DZK0_9ACTN|nr:polysaccharide lyase family 7 protein [Actinacidiphila cocklensis]MDD1061162.1 polysaccharide lyase family 7 protein [Actinacidiphila cocklensis]CAG6398252.1 Ricin-type beta-trefoil lectin domain-containing protein [Actinacidiphila cocklensis]
MTWRVKVLAAVGAAGVVGAFGVLGSGSASAATAGPISGLGGKCVDVAAASSANGAHVQLYDCNGTTAQSWTVGNSDNSVRALGKCMDVTAASTASGAKVQLYDCNGTAAQQWTVSNGALVNTGSGKCLDATDQSSANGNQLQIWTCTGAANQKWTLPGGSTPPSGGLNTGVAPGGNFNLSVWQLQEPVGSPGSPTTISSSRLQGAGGYQDSYFYTDGSDGAMTFWAPEKGVTTPNSNYARSELREMNTDGSAADWSLAGTHRMNATLRVVSVTSNVCVGQIHLGSGGTSTKPLIELYYHSNGDIVAGVENSPDGGQTTHTVGHVGVGSTWNYTIGVSGGNTIDLTVNGSTTHYAIPSSFNPYKQYFKAGSYNQSSSDSTTNGARVAFYALTVAHS